MNAGHTSKGAGYGAVSGSYKESQITRAVARELMRLLKAKRHTVYDSTVDEADNTTAYLRDAVRKANDKDVDLVISLHCNASVKHTGQGVEVYTWKGDKLDEAVHVCYELSRLGFRNRGIKDGSNLYVIKNTHAVALLVEMFFLDNKTDQDIYKRIGSKGIAKAIAEAI